MWGEGPVPCDMIIVGEAPGAKEEREGRPFVGPSGFLLNEALAAADVSRQDVYITNVYKLRPPNNRDPKEQELNDHVQYIQQEFDEVKPRYCLLLGKIAAIEFAGEEFTSMSKMRGKWLEGGSRKNPVDYMITWHPAYTMYNPDAKATFYEDVYNFTRKGD